MKQAMRVGFFLASMAMAVSAHAAPKCTPTKLVPPKNYPGAENIQTTNNLIQPTGKSVAVEGQRLIISGHVLDANCFPVREAVVELWQTDPYGQLFLAKDGDLVNPNPVFAGAGRTITNDDGQFVFITAFPGVSAANRKNPKAMAAPHVNLRILADNFAPASTALFFQNDRRNADDIVYKKLPYMDRDGVTLAMQPNENGDLDGTVTLVLQGNAPYRTY